MTFDFDLLKSIVETPGAPGREQRIRALLIDIIKPIVTDYQVDNLGNLIAFKKGTGKDPKRILVAAHIDEISLMITHINDKGFARFHTLGGFDPKTLIAQRVIAHGREDIPGVIATKPIHLSKVNNEPPRELKISDLSIDFGMSGEKLREKIAIGDVVTRQGDLFRMGDCVTGKSLDNRASVYALVELLRHFRGCEYDVYALFCTQEEVGLRGATVAAHRIDPDFAINIDTTLAYDLPEAAEHERITELGKGTAIKAADGTVICDARMIAFLQQTADKYNIPWQTEVLVAGGTDTAALQRSGPLGAIAGCVSIPTRHIHTSVETVHIQDLQYSIDLLVQAVAEIHQFDFS